MENNRQTKAKSTLQVAAAVCGTRSTARFPLLVRLVPCYADCRLRPAVVNYAQPLGARQYETSRAGSSSTHATRHTTPSIRLIINAIEERKRKKENENHGESAQVKKKNKTKRKEDKGRPRSSRLHELVARVV